MFDSHCHPTDIEAPLGVLAEAKHHGVSSLLCCGYHGASNQAVVSLRRQVPRLPIALGLHPWFARESLDDAMALVEREHPIAIGECGLDGHDGDPDIPPLDAQFPVFEAQLDLAQRLRLPVTVHSRKAVNEVVAMVAHFSLVRGVLHAYSGSLEQARPLLERGWMVGVGGAITRNSAKRVRKMAGRLALEHVLFETDAPAIGLEGVHPPLVRPHHVVQVARAFAELRMLDFEEVVGKVDENARHMFGDDVFGEWELCKQGVASTFA